MPISNRGLVLSSLALSGVLSVRQRVPWADASDTSNSSGLRAVDAISALIQQKHGSSSVHETIHQISADVMATPGVEDSFVKAMQKVIASIDSEVEQKIIAGQKANQAEMDAAFRILAHANQAADQSMGAASHSDKEYAECIGKEREMRVKADSLAQGVMEAGLRENDFCKLFGSRKAKIYAEGRPECQKAKKEKESMQTQQTEMEKTWEEQRKSCQRVSSHRRLSICTFGRKLQAKCEAQDQYEEKLEEADPPKSIAEVNPGGSCPEGYKPMSKEECMAGQTVNGVAYTYRVAGCGSHWPGEGCFRFTYGGKAALYYSTCTHRPGVRSTAHHHGLCVRDPLGPKNEYSAARMTKCMVSKFAKGFDSKVGDADMDACAEELDFAAHVGHLNTRADELQTMSSRLECTSGPVTFNDGQAWHPPRLPDGVKPRAEDYLQFESLEMFSLIGGFHFCGAELGQKDIGGVPDGPLAGPLGKRPGPNVPLPAGTPTLHLVEDDSLCQDEMAKLEFFPATAAVPHFDTGATLGTWGCDRLSKGGAFQLKMGKSKYAVSFC